MNWTKQFKKAVTFSYDDGVIDDYRFVKVLNKYGLICTFNINSGIKHVYRIPQENWKETYKGHEVAVHTFTHPHLTECQEEEIHFQLSEDKLKIEEIIGEKVHGMAYPFGDFNDQVVDIIKKNDLLYARTVISNHRFDVQSDLLRFQPTCHHKDEKVFELIEKFLQSDSDEPQILYIWGHSYEFSEDNNWERLDKICEMLARRDDIFYGTNYEVLIGQE